MGPPGHGRMLEFFMERLDSNLNLSEEQYDRIRDIVDGMDKEIREFRDRTFPEMQKIMDRNGELIKLELTEDQARIFESMQKRFMPHKGRRGSAMRPFFKKGRPGAPEPPREFSPGPREPEMPPEPEM